MIEKVFAVNFESMKQTTSIGKHGVGGLKNSIVVIPYFNRNMYILHNHAREDLILTLSDGKIIKTRSKYLYSLIDIIKVECLSNSVKSNSQVSFGSTYVDDKNDQVLELDFPRIKAEDDYYLTQYFINHSQYYIPPEEVSDYLFRIPITTEYRKFIDQLSPEDVNFRTLRLPRSYQHTKEEDEFIYTNNVFAVNNAINKLSIFVKEHKPKEIESLRNKCINRLDLLKSTISELDDSAAILYFIHTLERAWVNYQEEKYVE